MNPRRAGRGRLGAIALLGLLAIASCSSDDRTSSPGPAVTFTTDSTSRSTAPGTTAAPPAGSPPGTGSPATGSPATGSPGTGSPATGVVPSMAVPGATTAAQSADVDPATIAVSSFATVTEPLGIAVRPGDVRLFVSTQPGLVVPIGPAGAVGAPVLDITALVTTGGEQGLLGLAFHPTEPLAYVDYTDKESGATHIDEFTVAADGTFDPASRRSVLIVDQPYANHNGGQLAFGPDGMLYIGLGDGGSADDPDRRALNVGDLLGKILRIDPRSSGGKPYTSPADNPFATVAGARPEVWSVGLRNPWRFSFDPATADLWIADVGQNEWEEIDVAWADQGGGRGVNFGWSAFEGSHRFNQDQAAAGATGPIFEYQHGDAGCSISGGARYRGSALPALAGWYVYGDYCAGEVRALRIDGRSAGKQVVLGNPGSVAAVAPGPDGELYVASVGSDTVFKIVAA